MADPEKKSGGEAVIQEPTDVVDNKIVSRPGAPEFSGPATNQIPKGNTTTEINKDATIEKWTTE